MFTDHVLSGEYGMDCLVVVLQDTNHSALSVRKSHSSVTAVFCNLPSRDPDDAIFHWLVRSRGFTERSCTFGTFGTTEFTHALHNINTQLNSVARRVCFTGKHSVLCTCCKQANLVWSANLQQTSQIIFKFAIDLLAMKTCKCQHSNLQKVSTSKFASNFCA